MSTDFYKTQIVQLIRNISQFVRFKGYLFLWWLVFNWGLFMPSVLAQDDGSGSGGGGGGGDSGGDIPTDPPPEPPMTWGEFYCNIFSRLLWIWPETPDNLTLAGLAHDLASDIPFVGDRLVYLVFSDLLKVLTVVVAVKLIKIVPAKF